MRTILSFFPFMMVAVLGYSQGIDFHKGTWAEALEKASLEDKIIFVDAYTSWCGPCKRMDANVFPKKEVGDFYNPAFINVKLNMEKGDGRSFAKKYRVSSYPSFLFIDGTGKVVMRTKGGRPANKFIQLGKAALGKGSNSSVFKAKYDKGDRTPEILRKYSIALGKSGKSPGKVANEYLLTKPDFQKVENLDFLYHGLYDVDSKLFEVFKSKMSAVQERFGAAKVEAKIVKAGHNTVTKAVKFSELSLLEGATAAIKETAPSKAKLFSANANMKYYSEAEPNFKLYKKSASSFLKKHSHENGSSHVQVVNTVIKSFNTVEAHKAAQKWANAAVSKNGSYLNLLTLAKCYDLIGKAEKAQENATLAIEQAKKEKVNSAAARQLLNRVKSLK